MRKAELEMHDPFDVVVPCGTRFHDVTIRFAGPNILPLVEYNPCVLLPTSALLLSCSNCETKLTRVRQRCREWLHTKKIGLSQLVGFAIKMQEELFCCVSKTKMFERIYCDEIGLEELLDWLNHSIRNVHCRRTSRRIEHRIAENLDRLISNLRYVTPITIEKVANARFADPRLLQEIIRELEIYDSSQLRTAIWNRLESVRSIDEVSLMRRAGYGLSRFGDWIVEPVQAVITSFQSVVSIEIAIRALAHHGSQACMTALSELTLCKDYRVATIAIEYLNGFKTHSEPSY